MAKSYLTVVVPHAVGVTVGLARAAALEIHLYLAAEELVKTRLGQHGAAASQLPFAHDGGLVSALLGHLGEGVLILVHIAEGHVVAVVVQAGHDLHPGRGTERLGIHIHVLDTRLGQCVDAGRLVFRPAVAAEAFGANVIGKEENDVGLGALFFRTAGADGRQGAQTG